MKRRAAGFFGDAMKMVAHDLPHDQRRPALHHVERIIDIRRMNGGKDVHVDMMPL